jgi:hypothetical protein
MRCRNDEQAYDEGVRDLDPPQIAVAQQGGRMTTEVETLARNALDYDDEQPHRSGHNPSINRRRVDRASGVVIDCCTRGTASIRSSLS